MRLTGLGKLVIVLLALGFAIGGFRIWSSGKNKGVTPGAPGSGPRISARPTSAAGSGLSDAPSLDTGLPDAPSSGTTGSGGSGGDLGGGVVQNANAVTVLTSKSSKGWLTSQMDKFNARGGALKVVPEFVETREAMHGILESSIKPVIYAPSTTVWATRLQSAWKAKTGADILTPGDAASYRGFLKTPIVFVTTQDKARFLRPLLGRAGGWQKLHDLGAGKIKPPWGRWQWAHADPLTANSGTMTLGAILADYASASGQDDFESVAKSQSFRAYVRELERGLKFDLPAKSGSSALFAAYLKDPTRYDCITSYESNALAAASGNPNLAVIYPQPTVVSESVAAVISAPWVSAEQKKTAQDFIAFLGSPESIAEGVREGLRPISSTDEAQAARLNSLRGQGFSRTFTATELPPYEALNAAAFNWRGDVGAKF